MLIKSFSAGRSSEIDSLTIDKISQSDSGILVKIVREKTDKTGEETVIFVPEDPENPGSDPVLLLERYRQLRPAEATRLFLYFNPRNWALQEHASWEKCLG